MTHGATISKNSGPIHTVVMLLGMETSQIMSIKLPLIYEQSRYVPYSSLLGMILENSHRFVTKIPRI